MVGLEVLIEDGGRLEGWAWRDSEAEDCFQNWFGWWWEALGSQGRQARSWGRQGLEAWGRQWVHKGEAGLWGRQGLVGGTAAGGGTGALGG